MVNDRPVGQRVGAILGAGDNKVVKFLGYGVYDGDLPCEMLGGMENPRITLDNGDVVWGCQMWWGNEDRIKAQIAEYKSAGWTIEDVRIGDQ